MSTGTRLLGENPSWATLDPEEAGAEIPSLSIRLDDDERTADGSLVTDTVWRLRIEAQTSSGRAAVGALRTLSMDDGSPPSRFVGFAGCPGAVRWYVLAELLASSGAGRARLHMAASSCCTEFGVRGGFGADVTPHGGQYDHDTLTGNGTISVPRGARVESFAFAAGGTDGTLVITPPSGALPTITVPAQRNYSRERPAGLVGPVDFVAAGDPESVVVSWEL